MDISDKSLITILGISLLLVLLAVPLVFRLIPRNAVYGFRTRASMADDQVWYSANTYFGQRLIAGTALGCVLSIVTCLALPLAPDLIIPVTVLYLALPSLVATLATLRFLRRQQKPAD